MRQRFKGVTSVPLRQNCPCHKNHPLALSRDIQRSVYLASKKKKIVQDHKLPEFLLKMEV